MDEKKGEEGYKLIIENTVESLKSLIENVHTPSNLTVSEGLTEKEQLEKVAENIIQNISACMSKEGLFPTTNSIFF